MQHSEDLASAMVEAAPFKRALFRDVTACIFELSNKSPDRWKGNGQAEVHIDAQTGREMSVEEVTRQYTEAFQKAVQKSVE